MTIDALKTLSEKRRRWGAHCTLSHEDALALLEVAEAARLVADKHAVPITGDPLLNIVALRNALARIT